MKNKKLNKESIKKFTKRYFPVIATAVVGAGVCVCLEIIYRCGVSEGMESGIKFTINEITDHLSSNNNFCVYTNSKGLPVVIGGVQVAAEEDLSRAVKMIDAADNVSDPEITNKFTSQICEILSSRYGLKLH